MLFAGKLESWLDPIWWLETAGEVRACFGAPESSSSHFHRHYLVERIKQLGTWEINAVGDLS